MVKSIFFNMALLLGSCCLAGCVDEAKQTQQKIATPQLKQNISLEQEINKLDMEFKNTADKEKQNELLNQLSMLLENNPDNKKGLASRTWMHLTLKHFELALIDINHLLELVPSGTNKLIKCGIEEKLETTPTVELSQCYLSAAALLQKSKDHQIEFLLAKYLSGSPEAKQELEEIANNATTDEAAAAEYFLNIPREKLIDALLLI